MLTPSQLQHLKANALSKTCREWADTYKVDYYRMYDYLYHRKIKVKQVAHQRVNMTYLREHATERTHDEWAKYFGVARKYMHTLCSRNSIKVKGSYGKTERVWDSIDEDRKDFEWLWK